MLNNSIADLAEDNSAGIREQILKYLSHWRWFLFSVFLFLFLAKLYLRYSIPEYKSQTTLLIKRDDSGGISSELAAFQDLSMFSGAKRDLDDEIEVLKSRSLVEKTIKEGNFNISYVLEGRIKSSESYVDNPVEFNFIEKSKDFFTIDTTMLVKKINEKQFELFAQNDSLIGKYNFGQIIKSNRLGNYFVNNNKSKEGHFKIIVNLQSIKHAIDNYKGGLYISPITKQTNVLEISYVNKVKEKSEDFLNKLVEIYNRDAILDKNLISEKTAQFINDRLGIITSELDGVEKDVEKYKRKNNITDLPTEAELYLKNSSESNKEEVIVGTQLKVVGIMIDFMKNNKHDDIIPANIVPDDNNSSALIAEYNNLVIERNRVLKSSTPENPVVIRVNDKINSLKFGISESLNKLKSSLVIKNNAITNQGNIVGGRISQIPRQEREFRGIFRQQQIKEELYLYLFKKREETAITLAATAPISKVVDYAYSSDAPISPKRSLIYLVSLILGLLIPFSIIYLLDLLDTKVKNRHDLDANLTIPFIGDVPHSDDNNEIMQSGSRTSSAEAIRIVRTNLEFVLSNLEANNKAKTIFLTSTIPKEGKTFIAINLAATIAISGKKVLLIGMDIRNPKLDEYVKLPSRGLTNFLSTKDSDIHDFIVNQKGYENFDILPAGVIPPNPAELLMSKKVEAMFEQLKSEYDYIVVDTAPVSLVTDTLLISKNADAFVYVVRANYLEKEYLKTPETLYRENKLPNMCVLLNDTVTKSGHGYGYGYGQEVVKEPWYKKIVTFSFFG
ncbi:GumC family protein [Flavobacterium sp.]|uniref:GumC family protein n=1 Tax=Flavobacterium sp. TaxID=239 RepID=UPI00374D217E